MSDQTVLVTGGSGYIGSHCIVKLLEAGYRVRTTVRDLKREPEVRAMVAAGGQQAGDRLSFAAANLLDDAGWPEAVAGCSHVLHVASPFPEAEPKDEDELIVPAREGALRVLRAARAAGVKRVVLTSSFAAVGYGHPVRPTPFTEADWTVTEGRRLAPYVKSKTLAEKAAWDFVKAEGRLELAVVNPVGVLGPLLGPDFSTSVLLVKKLLEGSVPGCPKLTFGLVDVRDVAELHLLAMTRPEAAGRRFLAVSGKFMTMLGIATVLRERLGPAARKVPTRELPDFVVRLVARFDPAVKQIVPELGHPKEASSDAAVQVLGWRPRPAADAIADCGQSLLALGRA